jgi:CRP-like cAMP-binding protein
MKTNVALAGSLMFLTLGDVLQLLGSNGVTGVLRINSQYAQEPGVIYLDTGNPINALVGKKTGLDALLALFGWIDGEFEFRNEAVTAKKEITQNRMEIILDGLRKLDDGEIEKLGPEAATAPAESVDKSGAPVVKGPLVDYMDVIDEEEFESGKQIVVEKSHGNWIWVIMEGQVDIIKEAGSKKIKILTLAEGSFIGSVQSFKMEGNIRSATTQAVGKVHLGVLDTQRLATEFSALSQDFRRLFASIDRRLKQITDTTLDIHEKKNILETFMKDKKALMKQGQKNGKLYVIEEGEAFVVRKTDHGYVPLARLGEEDVFGHIPFLDLGHEPNGASVLAIQDGVKVKELNSDQLQNEYDGLSTTFRNIVINLSTCISATTSVACEFSKSSGKKK